MDINNLRILSHKRVTLIYRKLMELEKKSTPKSEIEFVLD